MHSIRDRAQRRTLSLQHRLRTALERLVSEERGDVPGWVLITLMTAGIVVALWAVASDALVGLFTQAIDQFSK